jgi:serpin B
MKRFAIIATLAALAAVCISCAAIGSPEPGGASSAPNPYKALDLPTKSSTYVKEGNSFAINFIGKVNDASSEDFIVSPLSMQFLLGMLLDGAQGQTADEICKVLGYGAGEVDAVNEYCLAMLQQLPVLDWQTTLEISNAIVVNQKWPLLEGYKTTVGKFYKAEVENMDFTDKAGTVKRINKWCSDHTNGLIPKIIEDVDPQTLAILMNAIYFKSRWVEGLKFKKEDTKNEPFALENGSKKNVPMMKNHSQLLCQGTDVFTAVRLPYGNGAYNMVVVLPDEGYTLQDGMASLKSLEWTDFYRNMVRCEVDLWLPKFETKFHIDLKKILSEMGMPSAFDKDNADFKAMSQYALCLSQVTQDAVIKVDEEGTEAAAVSKTEMNGVADIRPGSKVVFHADRPFFYLITESSTGVILFAGRYSGK